MRRVSTIPSLLAVLLAAGPLPVLGETADPVFELQVIEYDADQGIVGLNGGERAGVAVGDRFWICSDTDVIGSGEIFFVTPDKSAGRLAGESKLITAGQLAIILQRAALSSLRDRMPPGATITGKVLRLPPGRHTAWIDIPADSGLRQGDQVVVLRMGLLISRGRVKLLSREASLVTLEPLVSNALPEPGDRVELWPAPSDARWGRLNSTVLRVTQHPPGTLDPFELTIAGTAGDGLAVDRSVDVYRGRRYVGLGRVVEVSIPNSIVRMPDVNQGATTTRPADGDRVIVRAAPDAPPGPLTAPVFNKVDQDYCLIAAGELDGIRIGEQFLVRRQDPADPIVWHDVAMLTVDYLAPAHCGAHIKPLTSLVAGVQVGDMAERQVPGVETWRPVGIVETVDAASRTAIAAVEPGCPAKAGTVVAWLPERDAPPGAAVVLRCDNDHLIVHVPTGWGDLQLLPRSRVDVGK
ncbi:MAG TPA: hypothetical protein PL151_20835 [Phycisphaerae bacterium]|nr:hypothetical protein [Phycisphaerae bacterium]HOJ74781.1 hypothetical protein [Phycisphaerae bacterium]HOM52150.1 hypothetical protein [Phycisphaerae bacterium]HON67165.1 hypothetical protein [Phycisphaerae bacterium]HOQ86668.1 hypothetical protein [Phycisphaerae bacterium]